MIVLDNVVRQMPQNFKTVRSLTQTINRFSRSDGLKGIVYKSDL